MAVKVIYIMGVGRSGSTILGIVLGNHPRLEGAGELCRLHRFSWSRGEDRRCACGLPVHQCPYWKEIYERWAARFGRQAIGEYIDLQDRFESTRHCWPRLLYESRTKSRKFLRFTELTTELYEEIRDFIPKDVVVDASKNPRRAYVLSRAGNIDLRVIHLVRDGRAVAWSHSRPRKKDVAAGVPKDYPAISSRSTSIDWALTNAESEWVARKTHVLRVGYEAFVEDPCTVLKQIGTFVDENLAPLARDVARGQAMNIGHNLAGNQMRMASSAVVRPNMEWKEKLPPEDRRVFWCWAGWMARRYGYERRENGAERRP